MPIPTTAEDSSTADALLTVPKTPTRVILRILFVVLLATTVMLVGTSLGVFSTVHGTMERLHTNTIPAIRDVLKAQQALVNADNAAVDNYQLDKVELIGPGPEHQNQLAFASQNLTRVAEYNTAGPQTSQQIQVLEVLLGSYSGLIVQAYTHFGTPVGTADLWAASHLLHAGDSPILPELDKLLNDQIDALGKQIAASSMMAGILLVGLELIFLLMLLVATQVFLARRFRRRVNPWLLFTTAIVGGLLMTYVLLSPHQLENSQNKLAHAVDTWERSAEHAQGPQKLGALVQKECGQTCGPTVEEFVTKHAPTGNTTDKAHVDEAIADVDKQARRAANYSFILSLIMPITATLMLIPIYRGLWPRIEEYRYRPR